MTFGLSPFSSHTFMVYVLGILSSFGAGLTAPLLTGVDVAFVWVVPVVGAALLADDAGDAVAVALAVVVLVAVFTVVAVAAVTVATCGVACSSQWNGSKLAFGSTHDGFFDA